MIFGKSNLMNVILWQDFFFDSMFIRLPNVEDTVNDDGKIIKFGATMR